MLSALEAHAMAAGRIAAARARLRVANALRECLPGVRVTIDDDGVVLEARLDVNDPRLRWIGSML